MLKTKVICSYVIAIIYRFAIFIKRKRNFASILYCQEEVVINILYLILYIIAIFARGK